MRSFHDLQCLLCFQTATPSHIKTRGSGGDDSPWNIVALCFKHHTQWGMLGWKKFCDTYPSFKQYIEKLGWDTSGSKLFHSNMAKENK